MRLYDYFINNKDLINHLESIAINKGYSFFKYKDNINLNINLWGIRSNDKDTTKLKDVCLMFYQNKDTTWTIHTYKITTDPSNVNLQKPINKNGTAIVKEGQYKGLFKVGLHKGYEALVQAVPITVIRVNI